MFHHVMLAGQPGSSKSTCGLSFPGVEQHVYGSSEEYTAINFSHRKDILPPLKWDWIEFLTPEEKVKLFADTTDEMESDRLKKLGTARKIRKYRKYLYQLKDDLLTGKRDELKTVFLDNGTPFLEQYRDWFDVVFEKKYLTAAGNYDSIKASIDFASEVSDFLELFNSLPCHTVMSFHVQMAMDEETAAKADFMNDAKKGIKHAKEFQPMITGKIKYSVAGKFDYAFFLYSEENPGQPNKYIAKLEADSASVGIAKSRIQPFPKGGRIELPNGTFFEFLESAIQKKIGVKPEEIKK